MGEAFIDECREEVGGLMLQRFAAGRMLSITEVESADLERQEAAAMGEADLQAWKFIKDAAEHQPRGGGRGVGRAGDQVVEKESGGSVETDRAKRRVEGAE